MNTITAAQRNAIFALLHSLHLLDVRAEIVLTHTEGRTASITKLTQAEAGAIIDYLKTAQNRAAPSAIDRQRRKLIAQFHTLGWHKINAETGQAETLPDGRRKLNYERIDAWLIKHTPAHKPLNQMDAHELQTAVTIAQKMATQKTENRK